MADMNNVTIENCRIAFRNFSGKESKFNAKGSRNFVLLLDEQQAEDLERLGWSIKYLKPRDDEPQGQAFIKVAIAFDKKPPKVLLVTTRGKTFLDEESIDSLDHVDIETADITLNPYEWDVNGLVGVKAYVKTLIIKQVEDYLEMKWDRMIEGWQKEKQALPAGSTEDEYIDAEFYETPEIGA